MTSTEMITTDGTDLGTTPAGYEHNVTTHVYDTYDLFIHPHWYQYGLIAPGWHYAMGIFITFVSIFGSLGNLLVMYIFGTFFGGVNANVSKNKRFFSTSVAFPCELYGLVGGIFGLMSINTLAVIAFDRYSVIARPIKASRTLSYRKAFMMLVFVWCWSTTWTIPPLFGWGAYIPEGFQTSCTFDYLTKNEYFRSYILCLYICGFAFPLLIIFYCYFHIYRAVALHEKISQLDSDTGLDEPEGTVSAGMRMKSLKDKVRKGGADGGHAHSPAQQDNSGLIKDIITAFAGVMATQQAGAQQSLHLISCHTISSPVFSFYVRSFFSYFFWTCPQVPVYLPPQVLAGASQNPELQQAIYAISQGMGVQAQVCGL
ncbi:rhodopsin-like [Aplysia californica]|uniref:Rhodopsin-like n=1 Tax=Aplysia californica TaxID=6500 RepID=A0ABM1VZC7_APLCA|nr:rhodopsin-like [Aplysia californica]